MVSDDKGSRFYEFRTSPPPTHTHTHTKKHNITILFYKSIIYIYIFKKLSEDILIIISNGTFMYFGQKRENSLVLYRTI